MIVAIATDHRGFELKNEITTQTYDIGEAVEWVDLGAVRYDSNDDYVDYAVKLVEYMLTHPEVERGVLVCGSGVGMSMVANKFVGIRCGVGFNVDQVISARNDDDINVLAVPGRFLGKVLTRSIVEAFLKTSYSNLPRYQRRLDKIRALEEGQ